MTKGEWMNQVVYVSVYMHVKGGGNVCKIKIAHEERKMFHLASPCSLHGIDHCRRGSIHSRSLRHVGIIWSTRHFRNLPPVCWPRRCRCCCGECYRWGRWILDSILIHCVCGWSCRRGWVCRIPRRSRRNQSKGRLDSRCDIRSVKDLTNLV